MVLPNFLIIGSGRSGTTSLHSYLDAHPEVFMSGIKETNFFAFENRQHLYGGPGAKWLIKGSVSIRRDYEALFDGAEGYKAIGEASPRYLYTPEALHNIKATLPDAKLVVILRNPVERAYASYVGMRRDGLEKCRSFRDAIADQDRRISENWALGRYIEVGYYSRHLKNVFDLFPRDQVKIYLYEDLRNDPVGLLQDLFGFLDVSQDFVPDMSERKNESGIISNPVLRTIWTGSAMARTMVRPYVPLQMRHMAGKLLVRNLKKTPIDDEMRCQLTKELSPDILSLQNLVQRDLSGWLVH